MRFPLGLRIFLGTALVVVAVLGAALLVTRNRANDEADAAARRSMRATRATIADALNGRSQTVQRLATALVQVPAHVSRIGESLRTGDRANLLDQADELRTPTGSDWVLITDGAGVLKAWTMYRNVFDQDFSRGSLIGRALEGQTTQGLWIEPSPEGDELYQAVGVPVTNPGSTLPFGVVVAAVRIDSAFASQLQRHTNSEIVFFSRDTLGTPHVVVSTLADTAVAAAIRRLPVDAGADTAPVSFHLTAAGRDYEGATGLLRTADGVPTGGYLGLHDRDADLAPYRQLSRTIGWAFLGGLFLALAISVLMARRVTRSVRRLVEATRKVSEGQYSGRVEVTSRDEIGELAGAFSHMVEELREKDRLVAYLRTGAPPAHPLRPSGSMADGMLAVGTRFAGRYEIQEVIGAGGMGMVYHAFDHDVGETVAVKTLRPELVGLDPAAVERFKQELRLARRITHRNVVRTHDLGEVNGVYYITMEFVHGTTVAALIGEAGRLAVPAALTIGKQICRALEVAHAEGVVHRDIKPQNLLIEPSGFLKVMDFGIARLTQPDTQVRQALTVAGVVVGTPSYMAPEQLLSEPVDGRTDLYATGAVLFECVTGTLVYKAPSMAGLLACHLRDTPPDPATVNPEVSSRLSAIILKALARQPQDRWQSATELLRALEEVEDPRP